MPKTIFITALVAACLALPAIAFAANGDDMTKPMHEMSRHDKAMKRHHMMDSRHLRHHHLVKSPNRVMRKEGFMRSDAM